MYRVGLIGAGAVGRKRAVVVREDPGSELAVVHDLRPAAARALARECGGRTADSWREVVEDEELEIVVVSTTHQALASISAAALEAGKHVLCEKPAGRNPAEVRRVVEAAAGSGCCFKAGYNHRYHPAIARVHRICDEGRIGPIDFIRGCYGHGGRPGYEREWRGDPEKAGGGELLDQGAHLIDLSLWFLGDFSSAAAFLSTRFWDIAPLEDNAFALLRTAAGQVASLHVSWTQWKNRFSFEVFGREGYACARGLGGSYGEESALVGRRRSGGGAPEEERFSFCGEDRSWALEWADFTRAIARGGRPQAHGAEALRTMEWIHRLYRAAAEGRVIGGTEAPVE